MDFEGHPEWNPFILKISGIQKEGERLAVTMKPPGSSSGMTFKPVILRLDPNREFRWQGSLGFKGIFDGEHYFLLRETSPNSTEFIHGEKFGGFLVPFMSGMLKKTQEGFELMNEALKQECERG